MPYDADAVFTGVVNSFNNAVSQTIIDPSDFNDLFTDVEGGFNAVRSTLLNASAFVSTRTAMAALSVTNYTHAYLKESGREGLFVRVDSAAPAGDSSQGIYVASGTTGHYWKRVFQGEVNVRWFGATGDGTTDDTTAIANALTWCQLNSHTLYFPGGTYLTDPITHAPTAYAYQCHLRGESKLNTIIKRKTSGASIFFKLGQASSTIYMGDMTISGITFDGKDATTTFGFAAYDLVRSLIVDCKFVNSAVPAIFLGGISSSVRDCTFDGGTTAFQMIGFGSLAGGGKPNNMLISGCRMVNATVFGVYVDDGNRMTFENCDIEGNGTALADGGCGAYVGTSIGSALTATDTLTSGVTFRSCWFEFNKGTAQISLNSGKNLIDDCLFFTVSTDVTNDVNIAGGQYTIQNSDASYAKTANVLEGAGVVAGNSIIASNMGTITYDITKTKIDVAPTITLNTIELGHATDTTLTRASAGDIAVEGNRIFRAGGADVPVADGGTGLSAGTSGGIPYFSGSTTIVSSAALTANAIVKGGGAGAAPVASGVTIDGSDNVTVGGNGPNAGLNRRINIDAASGAAGFVLSINNTIVGYVAAASGTAQFVAPSGATADIGGDGATQLHLNATRGTIDVPLKLKSYAVASLPTGAAGDTAFVTDASTTLILGLGTTVAGGGANKVPVYSDGTNWKYG